MGHAHAALSLEAPSPCTEVLAPAVPQEAFQKVYWPAIMEKLKDSPALPFIRQGMTQYYGLNYEEAMRNFKMAKKLDRKLAMAPWGIALAAGPNINLNMDKACHELAKTEINCAHSLAGGAPQVVGCEKGDSTQLEKDLIGALKKRYDYPVGSKKDAENQAKAYSNAMADIWNKHQNDKNVSTLYAESMMDLYPWDLYDQDGLPKREQTLTIVDVLKTATGDSQEAIGGNHYYIHAIEGSAGLRTDPTQAERSADLLQKQVPESGHLVHMSSHIYLLLGEYQKSLDANIKGANDDVAQYGQACSGPYKTYTDNDKCPQLYYGHYLSHNYFFGSVSATFLGRSKDAIALACQTQDHVQRFVAYEPGLQRYLTAPLMTMVVNRNWDAVCAETNCKGPNPSEPNFSEPTFEKCYSQGQEESGCHILRAIWYWARGMARATYGKDASKDSKAMFNEIDAIEKIDGPCSEKNRTSHNTFGNNCASDVLMIGFEILDAQSEWADVKWREEHGPDRAFISLYSAVFWEKSLVYDEPPQWFTPAREAFGGAYLQAAKHPATTALGTQYYEEALSQFSAELERHPASGRALYGKMRALQGLDKPQEQIDKVRDQFCSAWQYADYTMTDGDLWPAWDEKAETNVVYTCKNEEKKKVSPPSECACQATTWPPPADAADGPANDPAALKCPEKSTTSAAKPSVTGTPPVP
jgi:hypothetical protein